ncbi:MAG: calcineurin-like phosphoesterase C-terminal domain-containing protein [Gemmatimonadota bacterium]|nr:MAG: calcineurin-like phosphoesterase C-terminal domain-containing protein [Gemmatimonadota bacterium]
MRDVERHYSRKHRIVNRRSFLKHAAGGAVAVTLPQILAATPHSHPPRAAAPAAPIRIRGQVRTGGSGLARVAVTDGFEVTDTAADGTFELISSAQRDFVSISLPAGHQIPLNAAGTARFYERIAPDSSGEAVAEFDLDRLDRSDENHCVFLLADIQTEDMDEMAWCHEQTVPDIHNVVQSLDGTPAFGISCGDIMFDNLDLYPEYERAVSRTGIPFFQVVGNHDMDYSARTDEGSTATFSQHFGPRYYSFNRGSVHYVILDDVFWYGAGYLGYIDADQLTWLAADLQRLEPGSTVIAAAHIPVLGSRHTREGQSNPGIGTSVTNRQALYRLLEPFEAHILTGHMHESEHLFEHGVHEHVNGAVSGAWWSGPICGDGTPSGYSVYDVRGSEITWRYKSTGHDFHHQVRLYARGADPEAPDEVVANVWDWDPAWEVVWYEGADRRGAMARRVGHDPLSVELHTGPELPPRRTWVEPYRTGHLFYAPVSADADTIHVEATDRFGRAYSATLPNEEGVQDR